jgi:two-component system chemotaxis sensor kinase CheA
MAVISDALVQQFRGLASERLAKMDGAWEAVLSGIDERACSVLEREIHTLKGESRVVGFGDVNVVCQRVEALLDGARARGYAVTEDLALGVALAIRFMDLLVRLGPGPLPPVIDLPSFLARLDELMGATAEAGALPPAERLRLGPAAVDAFLEYAMARGARRDRLRESWHLLRDQVGVPRAVMTAAQLAGHKLKVSTRARELRKQVDLRFEIAPAEVPGDVLAAVDAVAEHLLRNAVEHGIELPAARAARGKPPRGAVRVRGSLAGDTYTLAVEDDGDGLDLARVRTAELAVGAGEPDERELLGGDGGLRRAREVIRGAGGRLAVRATPGRGTVVRLTLPVVPVTVSGIAIRAPGIPVPIVLAPGWHVRASAPAPVLVDLAIALGLPAAASVSATAWTFSNGDLDVGLLCRGQPSEVRARRLVPTPPAAPAEVVLVGSVEGLLLRPDRVPGVLDARR